MYEVSYTKIETWQVNYVAEVDPVVFKREMGKSFEAATEYERLQYIMWRTDSCQLDEEYLDTVDAKITQEKLIGEA